jgi:hypothetical protein
MPPSRYMKIDLLGPYAILTLPDLSFSMPMMEQTSASEIGREERRQTPVHPGGAALRRAVRLQIVSFPSQVPVFLKRPAADMQWRIVLLYFVRGWSGPKIAARFNIPIHRVREILNSWSVRALELGYVQVIDPEAFAACCHADREGARYTEEVPPAEPSRLVVTGVSQQLQDAPQLLAAVLPGPGGTGKGGAVGQSKELIDSLDAAIAHCEDWEGEFWMRMATLLYDLRTAAAVGLELRHSNKEADGPLSQLEMSACDEERISHAVA